jgi:hypothetical protein
MPEQVVRSESYMPVPDGCATYVNPGAGYVCLGVQDGDTELKLTWKESQEETANAGMPDPSISQQEVEGSLTLANMDMDVLINLYGGMITSVATPGTEHSAIPDQVIAAGWADNVQYDLLPEATGSDSTLLKLPDKPVFTSVKMATSTTPETLTEDTDYVVSEKASSPSGWAIQFIEAGMTDKNNGAITIDWGANTPTARTTYYSGASKMTLDPFIMKFEHTDDDAKVTGAIINRCYPKPGSFQFGYGAATKEGHDTIKFEFKGVLDTTLTSGQQLFSRYIDE